MSLLSRHQCVTPRFLRLLGQMTLQPYCRSVRFERIGEHAHPLKMTLVDKLSQLLKLLIRLARETGDERGSQDQVVQAVAQRFE